MLNGGWLTIYTYLMPLLAGLSLLMVIGRVLSFWQKERGRRSAVRALVYLSLFVLFLFFSLYARMVPLVTAELFLPFTTFGYALLAVSMLLSNLYEWRDLVEFLKRKDADSSGQVLRSPPASAAPPVAIMTLKEIADDAALILEARIKEPAGGAVAVIRQAQEPRSASELVELVEPAHSHE